LRTGEAPETTSGASLRMVASRRLMAYPVVVSINVPERMLFAKWTRDECFGTSCRCSAKSSSWKSSSATLAAQIEAKKLETSLIDNELVGVQKLFDQNLISIQRLTQLKRDSARIQGEYGQLIAATAQAKVKLSETELQILQIDQDLRSEVAREIREIQGKVAELVERKVAAEDQLKKIDLRAPQDGTVHQLAAHTVGGVIAPGELVMMIVPQDDVLTVEAHISPQDIEQVRTGQSAVLRMTAFNQRTTPEAHGDVLRVSPDATVDPRTGGSYFTVRIGIDRKDLPGQRLVPGMPVEAFVQTGRRPVLSYLTKPLADQVQRAFTER
jgi:HlyD family secretion protein